MSDHEHESPPASTPGADPVEQTQEFPTIAGTLTAPGYESEPPYLPADEDDEWLERGPARGIRLGVPVAALIAVVLVAAGFWGGAAVEKNHAGSSSGGVAGLAARFRGLRGAGGTGTTTTGTAGTTTTGAAGGFGAAAAGTTGTVSVVAGNTLYVLTSAGTLVKVTLTSSTTIDRDAAAKSDELRPGDTVTIQGTTAANGNVTASSVAATAPGVTVAGGFGGGFGGGGGGFGGAGGSSTGSTSTTSGSTGGG
jgi:hypothetical protein